MLTWRFLTIHDKKRKLQTMKSGRDLISKLFLTSIVFSQLRFFLQTSAIVMSLLSPFCDILLFRLV